MRKKTGSSKERATGRSLLILWVALAVALAACATDGDTGGGDVVTTTTTQLGSSETTIGETSTTNDETTTTDASPSGPTVGGTAIMATEEVIPHLAPYRLGALAPNLAILLATPNMYSSLLEMDSDGGYVPELADSWEVSDDGLRYTFNLNPNAAWHDGNPVTAHDVAFTANTFWPTDNRGSIWWPNVASAHAEDDHTFVLELSAPFSPLLTLLASPANGNTLIVPQHIWESDTSESNPATFAPVGSGPFVFESFEEGESVTMVRNENYFKQDLPYLDRIVVQHFPDQASRDLAMETGEVDYLYTYLIPYNKIPEWRNHERISIVDGGLGVGTINLLAMNLDNEFLNDQSVRQAIAYAVDREAIVESALFGEGGVATSPIASSIPGFYNGSYDVYQRNIDTANSLLDEAGYERGADGNRFTLRFILELGRDFERRTMEIVTANLAEVGIEIEVEAAADLVAYRTQVFVDRDYDLTVKLFITGPDPTIAVSSRYIEAAIGNGSNSMGYVNEELEEIFATEFTIADENERFQAWDRIQEVLMEELPVLPLTEVPNVQAVSCNLHDWITSSVGYLDQNRSTAYWEDDC